MNFCADQELQPRGFIGFLVTARSPLPTDIREIRMMCRPIRGKCASHRRRVQKLRMVISQFGVRRAPCRRRASVQEEPLAVGGHVINESRPDSLGLEQRWRTAALKTRTRRGRLQPALRDPNNHGIRVRT